MENPTSCAEHSTKKRRKLLRNCGESYINVNGKYMPAKQFVDYDCQCKDKCLEKLSSCSDREEYFNSFWKIGNFNHQNEHLFNNVTLHKKKIHKIPRYENKSKTITRMFYIKLPNHKEKVRVCKTMFLKLHGVSNGRLDRVLQGANEIGEYFQDRRGHHTPGNKTSEENMLHVINHINSININVDNKIAATSFANENNCYIKDTSKTSLKYFSKKKMYNLYKQQCINEDRIFVSIWTYLNIFKNHLSYLKKLNLSEVGINDEYYVQPIRDLCLNEDISAPVSNLYIENIPNHSYKSDLMKNKSKIEKDNFMSRKERKSKRNCGESYATSSGSIKMKKVYNDKNCGCKYNCIPDIADLEKRTNIFKIFWKIGDFVKQNEYIANRIELVPIKKNIIDGYDKEATKVISKTCTRIYNIIMCPEDEPIRVCKKAFLELHGISNGRVDRIMQVIGCDSSFSLQDRRGHHIPKNKTNLEDIDYICKCVKFLYFQEMNSDSKNHSIKDLNVGVMYKLYREHTSEEGRKFVSNFTFRKIMKENLNDLFKSLSVRL